MAQYFGERNKNGIKLEYTALSSGLRGAQIPAFGVFWSSFGLPKVLQNGLQIVLQKCSKIAPKLYIMFTRGYIHHTRAASAKQHLNRHKKGVQQATHHLMQLLNLLYPLRQWEIASDHEANAHYTLLYSLHANGTLKLQHNFAYCTAAHSHFYSIRHRHPPSLLTLTINYGAAQRADAATDCTASQYSSRRVNRDFARLEWPT